MYDSLFSFGSCSSISKVYHKLTHVDDVIQASELGLL